MREDVHGLPWVAFRPRDGHRILTPPEVDGSSLAAQGLRQDEITRFLLRVGQESLELQPVIVLPQGICLAHETYARAVLPIPEGIVELPTLVLETLREEAQPFAVGAGGK